MSKKHPSLKVTTPAACHPVAVQVEPGKIYSWCTCGLSEKQPFCDGKHKVIDDMPCRSLKLSFEEAAEIWFCQCKQTSDPPFCDDTHHSVADALKATGPG